MDAKDVKKYLLEKPSRIEELLEEYGFSDFYVSAEDIRCAPPGSENKTAAVVKLDENLFATIFSGVGFKGDIFGCLQFVSSKSFGSVMSGVHRLFGLRGGKQQKADGKNDMLSEFRKYKRSNNHDKKPNRQYNKSILNKYIHLPHASWIKEKISPKVMDKFDICYDPRQDRILIPHYDWIDNDKVVGLVGRTTMSSELLKEFDVPKYWHYLKGYQKTQNLYGWNFTKDNIESSKMLIIFEAEKSVLKHYTIEYGKGFSVSVGGHAITKSQVAFILENTPMDTEIVIAFDSDIMTMEDGEQYLIDQCKMFNGMRKVSYVFDRFKLLGEKDSPIDRQVKLWKSLLKFRRNVD